MGTLTLSRLQARVKAVTARPISNHVSSNDLPSSAKVLALLAASERFSNVESTIHLPSSAEVLALLASNNADDDTVQQAA